MGSKPILVVTACVYSDKMPNAHRAGADVVLLKPCLPDMLLQELKRTIDATKLRLVSVRDRRSGRDRRAVWRRADESQIGRPHNRGAHCRSSRPPAINDPD